MGQVVKSSFTVEASMLVNMLLPGRSVRVVGVSEDPNIEGRLCFELESDVSEQIPEGNVRVLFRQVDAVGGARVTLLDRIEAQ